MIIIDDVLINQKESTKNAGSKARNDINRIFSQSQLLHLKKDSENKIISYLKFILNISFSKKSDIFLVQYPLYGIHPKFTSWIYTKLAKKKSILLIHDINSLRYAPNDKVAAKKEINVINKFKVIISHNEQMTKWLKSNGMNSPVINLKIFDYLGEGVSVQKRDYDVAYAGNLLFEKSKFIYQATENNPSLKFEFYGVGFDPSKVCTSNYTYQGSKDPEELLSSFHSKFGLIWDGDSINGCTNCFGNYLKYNNPHKLSLYISANIPVITWKHAAIASFVTENNIGIVVDSLKNLDSILNNISSEQYEVMLNNIKSLSTLLKQGDFTKQAVKKAEGYL